MLQRFRENYQVWLLLFCGVFLMYPMVWGAMAAPDAWMFWPRLTLFDNSVMALWALFLLLTVPPRLSAFVRSETRVVQDGCLIALLLLGVLLAQQFRMRSAFNFSSGLFLLTIPLFGAVFAPELRRTLPVFALILFALNLAQFGSDWYFHYALGDKDHVIAGLTSNWNWSASLLVSCAPLLLAAFDWKKPLQFNHLIIAMLGAALLSCLLMEDRSKGMLLSLSITLALLFAMRYDKIFTLRRSFLFMLAAGIAAVTIGIIFKDQLAVFLANDVRLDLWSASWKLFTANPVIGCGQDLFVGKINIFIPEGYHLSSYAGNLHYHPHNELLLLLSELGIAGGLYFAGIVAVLAIAFERMRGKFDFLDYALFAAAMQLLAHGLADMTLYAWPLRLFFFLIIGMLWRRSAGEPVIMPLRHRRFFMLLAMATLASVLLLLTLNAIAGYMRRSAGVMLASPPIQNDKFSPTLMKDFQRAMAIERYRNSLNFKPTPDSLYAVAVDKLNSGNYKSAIQHFKALSALGYDSYIHSDGMIALAYTRSGNYRQALPYFEREQKCYPFGSVNLYFHSFAESKLGNGEEAKLLLEACEDTLRLKGCTMEDLPLLMHNPALDYRIRGIEELRTAAGL